MKIYGFFIFTISTLFLSLFFTLCTFGADLKVIGADFNNNDVICTGFVTNGTDDQTLVVAVGNSSTIAYVDEISVDKDGYFRLTLNTALLDNGSYSLRIGGKNISTASNIYLGVYTTGMAVIWGDADSDQQITAADAANALDYALNSEEGRYSPAVLLAIDVNANGYFTAENAALILQKALNSDFKLPVEVK